MIIVEGPDGAGKSRLVGVLREELKLPVSARIVGSDTKPLFDLKKWVEENVEKGFQELIFDRHRLISEPIYGPAMGRKPAPGFDDLGWMSDMMWRFYQARPIVIYCLPDPRTVLSNIKDPGTDNAAVWHAIPQIYAGYVARASMDFTRGVGRLYNYKVTRLDDLVGWVKFQLEERKK